MTLRNASTPLWNSILIIAIVAAFCGLIGQGISVSLGQSQWRRTSQGWEAAADSRPIATSSANSKSSKSDQAILAFKSLGFPVDVETVHAWHRVVLPLAIAGLIGSLGFWFLLWDWRELPA